MAQVKWRTSRAAKRTPSKPRLTVETLEDRLAPAVLLEFENGVLTLTQEDDVTPDVEIRELTDFLGQASGQLEIALFGDTFSFRSAADDVFYDDPGSPESSSSATISFESTAISQLVINLPGHGLRFGQLVNASGLLKNINVTEARTIGFNGIVNMSNVVGRGNGEVFLAATDSIDLPQDTGIVTDDGDITLSANLDESALSGGSGVTVSGATVRTTGSGNISIIGKGQVDGPADMDRVGVAIIAGGLVECVGSGRLTIDGKGGAGDSGNRGVLIAGVGTAVTTGNGHLTIGGEGQGSGSDNNGIDVLNGALVQATGLGSVKLRGVWFSGAGGNVGVRVEDTTASDLATMVTTAGGNLDVFGSSVDAGAGNAAIRVGVGGRLSAGGAGTVRLEDLGGQGIEILGEVSSDAGNITVLANKLAAGDYTGIDVAGGRVVSSTGAIQMSGRGGRDGLGTFHGIAVTDGEVRTGRASPNKDVPAISLTGTGGDSAGFDFGLLIDGSEVVATNGSIKLTGNGGGGLLGGNDGVNLDDSLATGVPAKVVGKWIEITGTKGNGAGVGIHFVDAVLNASASVELIADNMGLVAGSSLAAPGVMIRPKTPNFRVALGDGVPGAALQVTNPLLNALNTQVVTIGKGKLAGNIIVGSGINPRLPFHTLSLMTAGAVSQQFPSIGIKVDKLAISSTLPVGKVNAPLLTAVNTLAVQAGTPAPAPSNAGVFISNVGNLTIDTLAGLPGITAYNGNVEVTTTGSLTVVTQVVANGSGQITLKTIDTTAANENIVVKENAVVHTPNGNLTLRAADNLSVLKNARLIAGGAAKKVLMFVDNGGNADAAGGLAHLVGSVNASEVNLTGSVNADTFQVTPSLLAPRFVIDGADDVKGSANRITLLQGINAVGRLPAPRGKMTFNGGYKPIEYTRIQHVPITGAGNGSGDRGNL